MIEMTMKKQTLCLVFLKQRSNRKRISVDYQKTVWNGREFLEVVGNLVNKLQMMSN